MSSTIRKRVGKTGKVSYQAQVFSGKNAFVGSKTFDRRKDAVAWISEKQSELKAGVDLTSSRALAGNALDAWEGTPTWSDRGIHGEILQIRNAYPCSTMAERQEIMRCISIGYAECSQRY